MDTIINSIDTLYYKIINQEIIDFFSENVKDESTPIFEKYLPTIVALFVMIITNLLLFYKIKVDSKAQIKREFLLDAYRFDNERLQKFYNPIFILLEINANLFTSFGPNNLTLKDDGYNSDIMLVWERLTEEVIIPNNDKIVSIVANNSYLLEPDDDHEVYIELLRHIESYKQKFKKHNMIHTDYKYNPEYLKNVKLNRLKVLTRISTSRENFK